MSKVTSARPSSRPWAFLVTFACYGARLHGNERGSVDRFHNLPNSRYLPANPRRERYEREIMHEPAYTLDANRRRTVLEAIRDTCRTADWILHAVHIRTNHVHAVIEAEATQQTLLGRLKGRCSHDLRALDPLQSRKWARHGSIRELWTAHAVNAAVDYVVRGQGKPLEAWENPDRWKHLTR